MSMWSSDGRTVRVGDRVTYRVIGGERRVARVTSIGGAGDEKDGQPTFDGVMDDGSEVWGYVSDIYY